MSIVSPATGLSAKYRKHVFYREKLNVTMYNIQLYNAQNRNRHGKKKRLVLNTKGKGHYSQMQILFYHFSILCPY